MFLAALRAACPAVVWGELRAAYSYTIIGGRLLGCQKLSKRPPVVAPLSAFTVRLLVSRSRPASHGLG